MYGDTGMSEPRGAYSVDEFAKANSISRAQVYIEIRERRLVARKIGVRTVITDEDGVAWRRSLPVMATTPEVATA
jgi:hypothetical protein